MPLETTSFLARLSFINSKFNADFEVTVDYSGTTLMIGGKTTHQRLQPSGENFRPFRSGRCDDRVTISITQQSNVTSP